MMSSSTTLVRGARSTHTTIAWKMLMAVTGVVFLLYVLLHMYGNLKAFAGHDAYNDYAEHLRTLGEPMLPYCGLPLGAAGGADRGAGAARVGGAEADRCGPAAPAPCATRSRRTWRPRCPRGLMRWGGLALLLFVIWHLINFTIGKVNVTGGPTNDPYNLLVDSFSTWWLTRDLPAGHGRAGHASVARGVERRADPRA